MHTIIQGLRFCGCDNPNFKLLCVVCMKGNVVTSQSAQTDQLTIAQIRIKPMTNEELINKLQ